MGTWNTGPFDNDSANDAVNALVNGTFCMAQFRFECGLGSLGTVSYTHLTLPTKRIV